jgi:hypothetical protein
MNVLVFRPIVLLVKGGLGPSRVPEIKFGNVEESGKFVCAVEIRI